MSASRPHRINLTRDLKRLCARNRDGSYATQAARRYILGLCAEQLKEAGFYNLSPLGLKPKHVECLTKRWLSEGKSSGMIKNRMTHLRWWAEKVNKQNVIARNNTTYGIPDRQYVTNQSKAVALPEKQLAKVNDERLRCSLKLQQVFGLRREECLKFQPAYADQGDKLVLKASWTKGGKAREILIHTAAQRLVLSEAYRLAGKASMIPPDKKYVEQLHRYEGMTKSGGLSKLHGLRHAYAQARYKELIGWVCPALGGKNSKELTSMEKQIDRKTRFQISQELGHEREEITAGAVIYYIFK